MSRPAGIRGKGGACGDGGQGAGQHTDGDQDKRRTLHDGPSR